MCEEAWRDSHSITTAVVVLGTMRIEKGLVRKHRRTNNQRKETQQEKREPQSKQVSLSWFHFIVQERFYLLHIYTLDPMKDSACHHVVRHNCGEVIK